MSEASNKTAMAIRLLHAAVDEQGDAIMALHKRVAVLEAVLKMITKEQK